MNETINYRAKVNPPLNGSEFYYIKFNLTISKFITFLTYKKDKVCFKVWFGKP